MKSLSQYIKESLEQLITEKFQSEKFNNFIKAVKDYMIENKKSYTTLNTIHCGIYTYWGQFSLNGDKLKFHPAYDSIPFGELTDDCLEDKIYTDSEELLNACRVNNMDELIKKSKGIRGAVLFIGNEHGGPYSVYMGMLFSNAWSKFWINWLNKRSSRKEEVKFFDEKPHGSDLIKKFQKKFEEKHNKKDVTKINDFIDKLWNSPDKAKLERFRGAQFQKKLTLAELVWGYLVDHWEYDNYMLYHPMMLKLYYMYNPNGKHLENEYLKNNIKNLIARTA